MGELRSMAASNTQHAGATSSRSKARPGYNEKAMAEIRKTLSPYENQDQVRLISTRNNSVAYQHQPQNGGQGAKKLPYAPMAPSETEAPPALPPRSRQPNNAPEAFLVPPMLPSHNGNGNQYGDGETPPPPPPRAQFTAVPPTPPRSVPVSNNGSNAAAVRRRMSPVTGRWPASANPSPSPAVTVAERPASTTGAQHAPLRVQNSREIQQQLQQQLQSMSIFPADNTGEPPPPYPMGPAALSNNAVSTTTSTVAAPPPPSYTQSLAMRGSPTLSSTSSAEYRRSPATNVAPGTVLQASSSNAALSVLSYGVTGLNTNGATSPASSMLSSSSRTTSSSAVVRSAWPARQTKTQSPVIMQSVKSTQVQKPVLQTATPVATATGSSASSSTGEKSVSNSPTSNSSSAPPPPSYEFSIQQKHGVQKRPSPVPVVPQTPPLPPPYASRTTTTEASQRTSPKLPPPPPYPSSAVSAQQRGGLEANNVAMDQPSNSQMVVGSNAPLTTVISKAKVRTIDDSTRSSSPLSDNIDLKSNESGMVEAARQQQSDIVNTRSAHHHTSPKPQRRQISPDRQVQRKSLIRNIPPHAYKFYMEQHVENVLKYYNQRLHRLAQKEREFEEKGLAESVREQRRRLLRQSETQHLRERRAKLNKSHFKKIGHIGDGGFGEVSLVRMSEKHASILQSSNADEEIPLFFAMKTLKKSHILQNNHVAHVIAERDILAEADNEWIVKLYYSFQDAENLYFVMEYIPCGDLMDLLIKEGTFSEHMAVFYTAELVCAIESVHSMGFIHRDIKPDNILIDAAGHIKLTDFGLCTGFRWTHNSKHYSEDGVSGRHYRQDSMDPGLANVSKPLERRKRTRRSMARSVVGTLNYVAPEVLRREGYNQSCDWWSLGVILFEMIIGYPPFVASSGAETQRKVVDRDYSINASANISFEARTIINQLLEEASRRLGSRAGGTEIKKHPFFNSIDFTRPLREQKAPYKPDLKDVTLTPDCEPFDNEHFEETSSKSDFKDGSGDGVENQRFQDPHIYEFTFRRFATKLLPEGNNEGTNKGKNGEVDGIYV